MKLQNVQLSLIKTISHSSTMILIDGKATPTKGKIDLYSTKHMDVAHAVLLEVFKSVLFNCNCGGLRDCQISVVN